MKRSMKFLLVVSCFLMLCANSFAFIYEVKVLRKWDDKNRRFHYFIGLSDFHDKIHKSNQNQLKKIEKLLAQLDKSKTKIAIEDLSSVNASGRSSCGRYYVNSRGGVLGGLAQTTSAMGLDVSNVEFRYCRVVALGPVLNNLQDDLHKFPSVTTTNMQVLHDEIMNEVKDILAYEDGPLLKKVYSTIVEQIKTQIKKLHIEEHKHLTVAQYLEKHSNAKNRLELLKNLLTFDSNLLDLRLTHVVTSEVDTKDKVIAIAGGAHIGRVSELLQKFGYKDVSTTKVAFAKEYNLQQCLGSNIVDGAFCVKPQPIELDFLDAVILSK